MIFNPHHSDRGADHSKRQTNHSIAHISGAHDEPKLDICKT